MSTPTPFYIAPEHSAVRALLTDQDRAEIERFKAMPIHEVEAAVRGAIWACYRQMMTPRARRKAV